MKIATFLIVIGLGLNTFSIYSQTGPRFDIQGHRGARGLMPENTIPAFKKALQLGVDTLELDMVVTKDGEIVVSHEPWFSSSFSLDKTGMPIPADKQRNYNIYQMSYDEVKQFDVGSMGNKDFPQQAKIKAVKPLLKDVFRLLAKFARENKLPVPRYNIEIKTEAGGDDIYHPKPDVFAKLVFDQLRASRMERTVVVQSFDVRTLQEMRKLSNSIPIALLVANKDGVEKNLEKLGFTPEIYSPLYLLVDQEMIANCHKLGMKVVPWTINELTDLERMKSLGLDGLITDYPDRAVKVFRR